LDSAGHLSYLISQEFNTEQGVVMNQLGVYLKHVRNQQSRSRLWAERQSRAFYPDEKKRQISHSYLRRIEEGVQDKPHPLKLHTLAELYGVDYRKLFALAGYLESASFIEDIVPPARTHSQIALAEKTIEFLESKGIHSAYFLNSLMELSDESLHLLNRLLTTWSLQERQLRKQAVELT
jgi:transcriptional regulator with XRE-family HTH domain